MFLLRYLWLTNHVYLMLEYEVDKPSKFSIKILNVAVEDIEYIELDIKVEKT